MPVPQDPEALLSRVVDTLIAGGAGRPPRALLVQKNPRDATLLIDSDLIVILLAWPGGARPGGDVGHRIEAALAAERPAVHEGIRGKTATVVIVGGDAPLAAYVEELPMLHEQMFMPLGYLRIAGDQVEKLPAPGADSPGARPSQRENMLALIAPLLQDALLAIGGDGSSSEAPVTTTPELRTASERAGEHLLAAEGLFSTRMSSSLVFVGGLIAVQLAFLIAWYVFGGSDGALTRMGSSHGASIRDGQWWRLVCAGYLHAGVVHCGSNALAMVMFGMPVAAALGASRSFILFNLCVIGGFALQSHLNPAEDGVGASGGVFGFMAALLVLSLRNKEFVPHSSRIGWAVFAVIYLVLNLFGSLKPGISMLGHLGGGITGALLSASGLITWGLPQLDAGKAPGGLSRWLPRCVAAALLGLVVVSFTAAFRHEHPWTARWPPVVVRVFLTRSEFAVDVPASLAETMNGEDGEDFHQYVLGSRRRDPVMVSVIVRKIGQEIPADPIAAQQALIASWTKRGAGSDLTWRKPPAAVTVDGRRLIFLDQVSATDDDFAFPRWIGVDGDREIDMELAIDSEATSAWRAFAKGVIGTLVRRSDAPP